MLFTPGHPISAFRNPLLEVKRTSLKRAAMSGFEPKGATHAQSLFRLRLDKLFLAQGMERPCHCNRFDAISSWSLS
jgi:hypothetical protein